VVHALTSLGLSILIRKGANLPPRNSPEWDIRSIKGDWGSGSGLTPLLFLLLTESPRAGPPARDCCRRSFTDTSLSSRSMRRSSFARHSASRVVTASSRAFSLAPESRDTDEKQLSLAWSSGSLVRASNSYLSLLQCLSNSLVLVMRWILGLGFQLHAEWWVVWSLSAQYPSSRNSTLIFYWKTIFPLSFLVVWVGLTSFLDQGFGT
jgi:hypothetical protein